MTIVLTALHIVACFLLIVVILIQGGRGQGLAGPSFSSGNVQSLFGTRAADFLTKATSAAAIVFLLTCLGLNFLEARKSRSLLAPPRNTAPVDMDAVKKALEKIKSEQASALKESVDKGAKEIADQAAKTAAEVSKAVDKKLETTGGQAQAEAQKIADKS